MPDSRVWCAVALLGFAACTFPDFRVPSETNGGGTTTCHNEVRDGDEEGVDCGGDCSPCPHCNNAVQDGDETGPNCGGSCAPCPTCDDEKQNGAESDVDCGGTCGKRCDTDQRCREGQDCASLVCDSVCQPSSCVDGVRNGGETGRDCGGGCPGCPNGSACMVDDDCTDKRCQSQVCVSAGCTDGIVNGSESDRDCGGEDCGPCAPTMQCKSPEDCSSALCNSKGICSSPTCDDGTRNQDESAVDCGGPNCAGCPVGKGCGNPKDCESGLCQSATCVPENGSGQQLSNERWTLSSSEPTATGDEAPFDGNVKTSWTSGITQYAGMTIDIDLGSPQIFFKMLLKVTESPYDQDFPGRIAVYVSNDRNFGTPSAGNVQGNQWTWIDFSSAQVGRYVRIVITEPRDRPWSLGELSIYN
jgi:hypothetical protein